MKIIKYRGQSTKAFKRHHKDRVKVEKLLEVIRMLENETELPPEYKAHKLIGNYKGCLECHVEGDFLLIWIDENTGFIEAIRLGSHSELFE